MRLRLIVTSHDEVVIKERKKKNAGRQGRMTRKNNEEDKAATWASGYA